MFKSFTERAATPPSDGIPTADYAAVPANMTAPVRESSSSASKFAHRMSTGMSNTMSNTVAAIGTNLASIELASISPTRSYDDSLQIGENGEVITGTEDIGLAAIEDADISSFTDEQLLERLKSGKFNLRAVPTAHSVIASCLLKPKDERFDFIEGQWVERLGLDMRWHLDRVIQVHKVIDDDYDWSTLKEGDEPDFEAAYDFGNQKMLRKAKLRHPEEGLKRIFGKRCWIWQQFCVLRLEEKLRFQKNHYCDFDKLDMDRFASSEWNIFLANPANADLNALLASDKYANATVALKLHIFSPFRVMEGLRNAGTSRESDDFDSEWDLKDPHLSVYTYLGVLGSGWLVPLLCVFVQFSAPWMLGQWVLTTNERFHQDYVDWCESGDASWEGEKFYGKCMMFTIVIMYLTKIVPDCFYNFFRSLGDGNDAHSKIMSMRKMQWDRGDDYNIGQMMGYKLDLYMNTGYICMLYTLNLFILFATDSVLEMMLDAIAVKFILELDEDFAASEWWDPNKRWIRGGALELVLGTTLRKSHLDSTPSFVKYFGVSAEDCKKVWGESKHGFKNEALAACDSTDSKYLTPEVAGNVRMARIAKDNKIEQHIIDQYEKPTVHFGIMSSILQTIAPSKTHNSIYKRYQTFYTWSYWEKMLYGGLCPLPEEGACFNEKKNRTIAPKIGLGKDEENIIFDNFDKLHGNSSNEKVGYIWRVLLGFEFVRGFKRAMKKKSGIRMVFRIADGVMNWGNIAFQILFPLMMCFSSMFVPFCY